MLMLSTITNIFKIKILNIKNMKGINIQQSKVIIPTTISTNRARLAEAKQSIKSQLKSNQIMKKEKVNSEMLKDRLSQ